LSWNRSRGASLFWLNTSASGRYSSKRLNALYSKRLNSRRHGGKKLSGRRLNRRVQKGKSRRTRQRRGDYRKKPVDVLLRPKGVRT
jgi:hypothetical protein